MPRYHIIDFLPDTPFQPKRGGAWEEAGRALEASYRAPLHTDLTERLVIAIVLLLPPLLLRLAEAAL